MMTKSLVNKLEKRVNGKTAPNSKEKEDVKILSEKPNGILLGIGVDPGYTMGSKKPKKVIIYDDATAVIEIDKEYLVTAYRANLESDRLKGLTFLVPVSEFSVKIDYKFQGELSVSGDIEGLVFFLV